MLSHVTLLIKSLEGFCSDYPSSVEEETGSGRHVGTCPGHRAHEGQHGDGSPGSSLPTLRRARGGSSTGSGMP